MRCGRRCQRRNAGRAPLTASEHDRLSSTSPRPWPIPGPPRAERATRAAGRADLRYRATSSREDAAAAPSRRPRRSRGARRARSRGRTRVAPRRARTSRTARRGRRAQVGDPPSIGPRRRRARPHRGLVSVGDMTKGLQGVLVMLHRLALVRSAVPRHPCHDGRHEGEHTENHYRRHRHHSTERGGAWVLSGPPGGTSPRH